MSLDFGLYAQVKNHNITHNLNLMADEAGIYEILWHPEENCITRAEQMIQPLTTALIDLLKRPDYYKQFNPENGWGDYEKFVEFVESVLKSCQENPDCFVMADR